MQTPQNLPSALEPIAKFQNANALYESNEFKQFRQMAIELNRKMIEWSFLNDHMSEYNDLVSRMAHTFLMCELQLVKYRKEIGLKIETVDSVAEIAAWLESAGIPKEHCRMHALPIHEKVYALSLRRIVDAESDMSNSSIDDSVSDAAQRTRDASQDTLRGNTGDS